MAEKYLKVMQGGITSYVPDNNLTRSFWAKYNKRVGNGRNSSDEIVTLLPASDEEVRFMTQPVAETAANLQKQANTESATAEHLAKLQAMIDSQQALINKFLLGTIPSDSGVIVPAPSVGAPDASEPTDLDKGKNKPGPKPKTESDGKDETKVNTEA